MNNSNLRCNLISKMNNEKYTLKLMKTVNLTSILNLVNLLEELLKIFITILNIQRFCQIHTSGRYETEH